MTNSVGLDPERMAMLATKLANAANDMEAARLAVHTAVSRAWWSGTTAERFRTQWTSQLGPRLGASGQLLASEGNKVRVQLEQQVTASNSGGPFTVWSDATGSFLTGGGSGAAFGPIGALAAATLIGKPLLSGSTSGFVGWHAGNTGSFNVGGQAGSYQFGASAGASGQACGSVGLADGHLSAHGEAGGFVGVQGNAAVNVTVGNGLAETEVGASADGFAGARGSVNGELRAGADGVAAEVGGEVFAGVEANAEASASVLGAIGTVGAGVAAGIGAHGHATAAVSLDKVTVGFDVGASLGIGLNLKAEIEIKPAETARKVWKGIFG